MVAKALLDQLYEANGGSLGFSAHARGNRSYDLELAYHVKHTAGAVQGL